MSKIIRDIGQIISLAEKVHTHLEDGKIRKAKTELKLILKLDIDELRRIQKEHGNKRLLEECIVVLNQAKRALRDLNSYELLDEAKELIDRIIAIERHELLEAKEDEREEDELYDFWFQNFHNGVLYHGTKDIFLPKIKHYGLTTNIKSYDPHDMKRLNEILQICGRPRMPHSLSQKRLYVIFLTAKRNGAIGYARDLPEVVGRVGILGFARRLLNDIKAGEIRDPGRIIINELNRMVSKYESMYREAKPLLLTIKIICSSILDSLGNRKIYTNFNEFKEKMMQFKNSRLFKSAERDGLTRGKPYFNYFYDLLLKNLNQIRISKRIPSNCIVGYGSV